MNKKSTCLTLLVLNFWEDMKIYSHFLSFLHTEMVQLLEILAFGGEGPVYSTLSILWQMMSQQLEEPRYQQFWFGPNSAMIPWYSGFNPLHAKFVRGNIKHIFTFHVIPLHWYDTDGVNLSSNKPRTYSFYIINIMAPGVLATQGARTSAAMILT